MPALVWFPRFPSKPITIRQIVPVGDICCPGVGNWFNVCLAKGPIDYECCFRAKVFVWHFEPALPPVIFPLGWLGPNPSSLKFQRAEIHLDWRALKGRSLLPHASRAPVGLHKNRGALPDQPIRHADDLWRF